MGERDEPQSFNAKRYRSPCRRLTEGGLIIRTRRRRRFRSSTGCGRPSAPVGLFQNATSPIKELLHSEPFESDNATPIAARHTFPRVRAELSTAPISANELQPPGARGSSMGPSGGVFMAKDIGCVNEHLQAEPPS
jgi:hypothetical protein